MKILFLHGWQSVPGGVKSTFLAQHGHEVINPNLPDDDFAEAARIAQEEFDRHQPDVVVGSSRGGAVAMNINSGNARLVLFCPAWKKHGTASTVKADSEELVRNSGLPFWTLIEVGNDHRLADPESLETMLEACLNDEDDVEPAESDDEDEDILERDWTGLCYTAALRWVRKAGERDWSVVHGTVMCGTTGRRVKHAWCERGAIVVDLARPLGARVVERGLYYRLAQPEVSKVYSSDDARLLALKCKHDGPWDESEPPND